MLRERIRGLERFSRDKQGNIALSAAIIAPLIISTLALGVDYGSLTLQQRELQQAADLAAITAAAHAASPEEAVADFLRMNGHDIPVRKGSVLLTANGPVPFEFKNPPNSFAWVSTGQYLPDPNIPVANRYSVTSTQADAAQVHIYEKADMYFANSLMDPPILGATGTAAAQKYAAFSIGSRLASLHDGMLNQLFGALTGTTIDLDLMDYRALVDARINALDVIDILAIDLGLQAGTYDDVLSAELSFAHLVNALSRTPGLDVRAQTALTRLANTLNRSRITIKLDKVLNLRPFEERPLGTADHMVVNLAVFDMLSGALTTADGNQQVALQLDLSIPGAARAKLSLAIGEPPVSVAPSAVGAVGTIIRTAQSRLAVELETTGVAALAGLGVRLPIYLELAHAEAKLAAIECRAAGSADVRVQVVPGIAELALGNVDTRAFANFGSKPRVAKVRVVDTPIVNIDALGYMNATNRSARSLTFYAADIANGTVKSVSTADTLTTMQTSLLKNLDIDVRAGPLTLSTPKALQAALSDTLGQLTDPLDTVLYNTLLVLGLKLGEADIQVSAGMCQRPVLVQ